MENALKAQLCTLYKLTSNYGSINPVTLVQLYKLQVRPVWEYGAEFYLNTKRKVASLQRLQNKFVRTACPVARSAPVDVLHVVVNLELVEHRLELLQLKYLNRLALTPTYHPLFQVRAQLFNARKWTGTYLPKSAVLRSAQKALQEERDSQRASQSR